MHAHHHGHHHHAPSRQPVSHGHGHDHGEHHDDHHGDGATRVFALVTLLNLGYCLVEAGYGLHTGSLALLSDALHNFGDVLGLALAWLAALLATRAPRGRHTYGWRRATLLAPLGNALVLVMFSGILGVEAIQRLLSPPDVPGLPVLVVAAIGIGVNLLGAWLVRGGHASDLNRRAAYLHLLGDAAVSLAAVVAGAGLLLLDWRWLDPVVSLLIGAVVALGSFALLRDAFDASMDAVPRHVDAAAVEDYLAGEAGVSAVHHVHIWSLGTGEVAMTAHLVRAATDDHDAFLDRVVHALDDRFGINHATLQVEHGACGHDRHDAAPHGRHPADRLLHSH